jgi:hypothetical protein
LTSSVYDPDDYDVPFVKGTFNWNGDSTHLSVNFNNGCDISTEDCDMAPFLKIADSAGYSTDLEYTIVPFDSTKFQGFWDVNFGQFGEPTQNFNLSGKGVLSGYFDDEEGEECTFTGTITPSSDKTYFTIAANFGEACKNLPSVNGKGVFLENASSSLVSFIFFTTDGDVFSGGHLLEDN